MAELYDELIQARSEMVALVKDLRKEGREAAEAEADYQRVKSLAALRMKSQGANATFITSVLKGDEQVAAALLKRDCAQATYDATREALNVAKLNARLIEAEIEREYEQERRT